ncbi:hypothetical protein [Mesorhizobium sp. B2-3-13]|uniref:hypothetical protein n=1 Tax=Mesorhizobium sp. B2-3-13 TaxID=2589951 RepID=UPI001AEE4E3E|nr:hypothetical protein [Mesorhizobium sp. B2-3-13]
MVAIASRNRNLIGPSIECRPFDRFGRDSIATGEAAARKVNKLPGPITTITVPAWKFPLI